MMSNPQNEKEYGCGSLVSKDNGVSWRLHKFPIEQGADPWAMIIGDGKAVFGTSGLGQLYMFYSPDGGESFAAPKKKVSTVASCPEEGKNSWLGSR